MTVFTLEDEQIVWTDKSSGICPSDVNSCRTVVDLFFSTDNIVWEKSSFQMAKYQTICSSETICSSSSVKTANERPAYLNATGCTIFFFVIKTNTCLRFINISNSFRVHSFIK